MAEGKETKEELVEKRRQFWTKEGLDRRRNFLVQKGCILILQH